MPVVRAAEAASEQFPGEADALKRALRETAAALRQARRAADERGRLLRRCLAATRALAAVLRVQRLGQEQVALAEGVVGAIESHLRDHSVA